MSKKGGSKKDLYQTIANLQQELAILRDQKLTLLNAVTSVLQQPTHSKDCWALQKNPGPCTCNIFTLDFAIKKVGGK